MSQRKQVSHCGLSLNINTTLYLCSVFFPRISNLFTDIMSLILKASLFGTWQILSPSLFFTVMETCKSVMEPNTLVLSLCAIPWKTRWIIFQAYSLLLGWDLRGCLFVCISIFSVSRFCVPLFLLILSQAFSSICSSSSSVAFTGTPEVCSWNLKWKALLLNM